MNETVREAIQRGRAALGAGDVEAAQRELDAAYAAALERGDQPLQAQALLELARAFTARGQLDRAVLVVERALGDAREAALPELVAGAWTVAADVRARLGDPARAREALEEAVRALDDAFLAARLAGDPARALELAEEGRLARERLLATPPGPAASAALELGRAARAREHTEERRRREQLLLASLFELSRRLSAERDPERLLAAVLDGALAATGAERGFLLLSPGASGPDPGAPDEPFAGLRVAAARNFDRADVRRAEFKLSRTVIERALAEGQPVLVRDAGRDAELAGHTSIQAQRLRAIACIPFHSSREAHLRGLLYLDNRFGAGTFAEADLPALAAFAAHAAVALENARLHARAEERAAALEAARRRAEELAARLEEHLTHAGDELGLTLAHLAAARGPSPARAGLADLVGRSPAMQAVYALVERFQASDAPVLIYGESGTGKELVARALHFQGARQGGPFVSENCAAIPEALLESVLFGHEPGAFTGATRRQEGLFEQASGGTLLLDEVAELTPAAQAKLLRVLQERRLRRVGGREELPVDVRVIAATHRDLAEQVRQGRFREDLYFRLEVLSLRLPPLRERREDLPLLLSHLLARHAGPGGPPTLSPEAIRALLNHAWPGNVRELENEVQRLIALGRPGPLGAADLSPAVRGPAPTELPPGGEGAPLTLEEAERRALLAALAAAQGSKARAADILGIPRSSLYHRLRRHRIADPDER